MPGYLVRLAALFVSECLTGYSQGIYQCGKDNLLSLSLKPFRFS